jgi:hypothetical protein
MATETRQLEVGTEVIAERDKSVETLQAILTRQRLETVSYEEAKALAYELMTFFEVFDEPEDGNGED